MNQPVAEKNLNQQAIIHITAGDLPLSCPTKGSATWNSHPKVYLELDEKGKAQCQYCGNCFSLDKP